MCHFVFFVYSIVLYCSTTITGYIPTCSSTSVLGSRGFSYKPTATDLVKKCSTCYKQVIFTTELSTARKRILCEAKRIKNLLVFFVRVYFNITVTHITPKIIPRLKFAILHTHSILTFLLCYVTSPSCFLIMSSLWYLVKSKFVFTCGKRSSISSTNLRLDRLTEIRK
jgi:hypothetical protein